MSKRLNLWHFHQVLKERLKDHLEKLYPFSVIGRTGSISAAAQQLNMGQAALSYSLKVLEEALEVQLFIREPRGVRLTQAGHILLEFATRLNLDLDVLEERLLEPATSQTGLIRVGTHETLAIHVWPQFLAEFMKSFPSIRVSLIGDRIDRLVHKVMVHDIDLALIIEPQPQDDLIVHPIYTSQLGFYVSSSTATLQVSPILKKSLISLEEADSVPIFTDNLACIRQGTPIIRVLTLAGLKLTTLQELNSFSSAMSLAAKGLGIAVLPQWTADSGLKSGDLREIKIRGINSHSLGNYKICASIHKARAEFKLINIFLKELKKFYKEKPTRLS